jgi:heme-degrading monooxygenase HmoA
METPREHPFLIVSELAVDPVGAPALERAFGQRLGEVDGAPGFGRLEVWRDVRVEGRYLMASWWDDPASLRTYLRSESHQRSHDRIPTAPAAPRAVRIDRYQLVAR